MRLERFTEQAQEAFQEAQEIMQEQYHTQLDVEHVFLALLRQPEGLTIRALKRLNLEPEAVTQQVERELAQTPKIYGRHGYGIQVYITSRMLRLVKRAEAEASQLNDLFVGVDHLLIAISQERGGAASRILSSFTDDQERISQVVIELRKTKQHLAEVVKQLLVEIAPDELHDFPFLERLFQQYVPQALKQGRVEGVGLAAMFTEALSGASAEGRMEGMQQQARTDILETLALRFDPPSSVYLTVEKTLAEVTELAHLRTTFRHALRAADFATFVQALSNVTPGP